MTAARRLHDDEGDLPSQIGVSGRRAGETDRADPIFQPVTAQRTLRGDVTPHSPWLDPSRGPIAAIASISTSIPG